MRLQDLFCLAVLAVAMMASSTQAESDDEELQATHDTQQASAAKNIAKREIVLIDDAPYESYNYYGRKVIYRRMSPQRSYVRPKPKPGLPRTRYGPSRIGKKPLKKYRGRPRKPVKKISLKPQSSYNTLIRKRKPPYNKQPIYPPHPTSSHVFQEPAGFGEPPSDYVNDNQGNRGYAEPPVDSYGAPLKFNSEHEFSSPQEQSDLNIYNFRQNENWYNQGYSNNDNSYSPSQKHLSKAKPPETYVNEHTALEGHQDQEIKFYSDMYKKKLRNELEKKKRFLNDLIAMTKKPIKVQKSPFIVGGQYAEPPARFYAKYNDSTETYDDDVSLEPKGSSDPDIAVSSVSPYVNYKNSNMAFSPQNLNDAFSVSD